MATKSVLLVYQTQKKDCGHACIAMISGFYGKAYSLEEIKTICPSTDNGISLLALEAVIKQIGLQVLTIKCAIDDLFEMPLPAIILWNRQHFSVLSHIGTMATLFYVLDPAVGRTCYSKEEFQAGWADPAGRGVIIVVAHKQDFSETKTDAEK